MENNFFDICVQVTILSRFVENEDHETCLRIVDTILNDKQFQEWTQGIDPNDVDHIASLFVKEYGSGIVSEIVTKLPKAMQSLLSNFEYLDLMNEIAKKELQHKACKEMYDVVERRFKCMLEIQREEIEGLKWKELSESVKK